MKVEHEVNEHRFVVRLPPYEASLAYARKGKILDFYHVYVPEPYRNRGLAGKILIEAFEYAKRENLKVVPSCPFIRGDFLPRFAQYQELVVKDKASFALLDDSSI